MTDDLPERIGSYDIVGLLGSGGMSTVYKGIQPSLRRSVAIKVLPLQPAGEDDLIDRFERESSIIASLNHPNIIQIIDRGADEGHYFIVMEYVDGCSLDDQIRRKRLPIYQIVNIALQVASGMEYAHSKGVVHRDIKPANILISRESGTVKVTDFGIAKMSETELPGRTLTREQVAMGTVDYMSPEQRRDSRTIDARSDIFSFGVLLFEMVTGRVPVGRFRDLHDLRDDTPPLLNRIALRCLQEDPGDRYPTFAEVIGDLKRLTEKEMVYRELLARVKDSVLHAPKKAKTAVSSRMARPSRREEGAGKGALRLSGPKKAWTAISGRLAGLDRRKRIRILQVAAAVSFAALVSAAVMAVLLHQSPTEKGFAEAEALLEENQVDQALSTLKNLRDAAGSAGRVGDAAEAQWRIAKLHEAHDGTRSAGVAYAYFVYTFGESTQIVGTDRMAEALFRAGTAKAGEGSFQEALGYLGRLRGQFSSSPYAEEGMFREWTILKRHVNPSFSEVKDYWKTMIGLCREFADRFPKSKNREDVLWELANIYLDQEGESNRAKGIETLREMARDYPGSKYLPFQGVR